MDDVPAGPASPEPRRPSLSVVVPVRNGGRDFERCLRRLRDSLLTDFELIVVDDGSTDDSADLAARAGATVYRTPDAPGPGGRAEPGRTVAARPADLLPRRRCRRSSPNALGLALARFEVDRGPRRPLRLVRRPAGRAGNRQPVSQPAPSFRPPAGRRSSTESGRPIRSGPAAALIRRDVFLAFGGFDPRLYPRPAIEDIELGYRLTRAGHRIVLARDVLATHMKRWTLAEMVRTDIFSRGVPWTLLIKRTGTIETDLNVKSDQKACVALTGVTLLAALACVVTALGGARRRGRPGRDRRPQSRVSSASWLAARDSRSPAPRSRST